jgi:hypothetical protein
MAPAAAYVQYEISSICYELANITAARLVFIADNIPEYVSCARPNKPSQFVIIRNPG